MGVGAFHPRQPLFTWEQTLECAEDSAHYSQQPALSLFFHSRDVLAVLMHSVSMQRWADAQKKFKGVTGIVSVVAIETIGTVVDCELCAEADIDAVAMRQVADVTDRVTAHRKDA